MVERIRKIQDKKKNRNEKRMKEKKW